MATSHHLVAAVELNAAAAAPVLARARELLRPGDRLSVVHVVPPTALPYAIDPTMSGQMLEDLKAQMLERARQQLQHLCEPHAIDTGDQHVLSGRIPATLHGFARDRASSALVIGSHGEHGWRRILGSHAAAILHGTPVDVFIVHLPPPSEAED